MGIADGDLSDVEVTELLGDKAAMTSVNGGALVVVEH
jgi:hypothetical protein